MFEPDDYRRKDAAYWAEIEGLGLGAQDLLLDFAAFVRRRDLVRVLAHYELFKQVIDLPGCVVDLGVYHGSSLFTWCKLMETFCPGDRSRKVFGFDWFEGLGALAEADGAEHEKADKRAGGYRADAERARALARLHNLDGLVPGIERVRLIEGDVRETLPAFLEAEPGLRIALLHLDLDLYEPTLAALEHLYDRVLPGGVVAFDEYALVPWEGETRAVEAFFASRGEPLPVLRKFPFSQQPHGYFVKA